ncbi:MAG: hypothetical protein AAGK74_00245 [Chloroflexota bacterium]
MNTDERIELLQEAQELLMEADRLIVEATRGNELRRTAAAYTLPNLRMLADEDHGYLGGNPGSLAKLIEALEGADVEVAESDA